MNVDLADHIAALIIDAVVRQGDPHSLFADDLPDFLEVNHGLSVRPEIIADAVARLEELGGIRRFSSSLAGDLLEISVARSVQFFDGTARLPGPNTSHEYDDFYERVEQDFHPIRAYHFGQKKWVNRVVLKLASGEISDINSLAPEAVEVVAPASDRVVSLGHNQQVELVAAADEVIAVLKVENAVDGDPDQRERFLAQLAAGKELIRAHSVRAYLVYETWVRMLGTLINRYKNQAIGEAARKLLGLLIEHIFGK